MATVPAARLKPGQLAVELPLALLPALALRQPVEDVWLTARDTAIVVGAAVTDAEALDQLGLPEGEAAIEVQYSLLPELVKEST